MLERAELSHEFGYGAPGFLHCMGTLMANGKDCPVCGKDVGYWAVALQLFWIRCPHCRTRLTYAGTSGTTLANFVGALFLVGLGGVAGVWVGLEVLFRGGNLLSALGIGLGVFIALAIVLGVLVQLALAPAMRRNRTLKVIGKRDDSPSEETW